MKVSVIIPVYKVEHFVLRCIESIINQTMTKEVECIIVNDCTPDKSMEIIQQRLASYHGNIQFKIINHKKNRGLAAVRNTGLDKATGDYIIHIDSDDWCEPDMLEKMSQKAIEECADIVVADYYDTFLDKEIYRHVITSENPETNVDFFFRGITSTYLWNKLIRRDLYIKNNLCAIEGLNYCEDAYMSICLFLCASKITHIKSAFLHYVHSNPNSYTNTISRKNLEDRIEIYNEIRKFLILKNKENQFKHSFDCHLAALQFALLKNSQGNLQKEWNKKYKVPIKYILRHEGLRMSQKIALVLASLNMLWAFNSLRFIHKLFK